MADPQSVIVAQPGPAALFMVLKVQNPGPNALAAARIAARFPALTVEVAEIGRRKADSREPADEVKPASAHIARVVIEQNGEERQIVRHSFPCETSSEPGLFSIAYCKTLDIPERMPGRMFGAQDGGCDRGLELTRAVSGASFFAPSLDTLRGLA